MLLTLSLAFASDHCSMWELDHGYTGADCSMANDFDYDHVSTTVGSGNLDLHWVPECMDGSANCAPEQRVRCVDGTRPAYHAELTGSDDWVIYFQGGGSCSRKTTFDPATGDITLMNLVDKQGNEILDAAGLPIPATAWAECGYRYDTEPTEMGTDRIPRAIQGEGILSDLSTNPFAGANRVKIHKCSYDRMAGVATREEPVDPATGEDAVLYFHGRRIAKAVMADLANNPSLVATNNERVNLDANDRVLFAGNSGGAGGLIFTADKYTDWIQSDLGLPQVETHVYLDARMRPSLENSAAFDASQPAGTDLYDWIGYGTTQVSSAEDFVYRPITYRTVNGASGPVRAQYQTWYGSFSAAARDDTCDAAHPSDPWRCYDEGHVLANFIETPLFTSHSLRDGNHAKNRVSYAEHGGTYGEVRWRDLCTDADLAAGRTAGDCELAYSDRAYEQVSTMRTAVAGMGTWTLDDTRHVQAEDDYYWGNTGFGMCDSLTVAPDKTTLGQAVWAWFDTGATTWYDETKFRYFMSDVPCP